MLEDKNVKLFILEFDPKTSVFHFRIFLLFEIFRPRLVHKNFQLYPKFRI